MDKQYFCNLLYLYNINRREEVCSSSHKAYCTVMFQQDDWEVSRTVSGSLKQFEDLVEMTRLTLLGPDSKERLTQALDTIVERTQDFTDSAYTSHEHRENILLLCDRAKLELNQLLRVGVSLVSAQTSDFGKPSVEHSIDTHKQ
jgi:hypothetical protein